MLAPKRFVWPQDCVFLAEGRATRAGVGILFDPVAPALRTGVTDAPPRVCNDARTFKMHDQPCRFG